MALFKPLVSAYDGSSSDKLFYGETNDWEKTNNLLPRNEKFHASNMTNPPMRENNCFLLIKGLSLVSRPFYSPKDFPISSGWLRVPRFPILPCPLDLKKKN